MKWLITFLTFLLSFNLFSQTRFAPKLEWSKCYGDIMEQYYTASFKYNDSIFFIIEHSKNQFNTSTTYDSLIIIDSKSNLVNKTTLLTNGSYYEFSKYDDVNSFIFLTVVNTGYKIFEARKINSNGVITPFKTFNKFQPFKSIKTKNGDVVFVGSQINSNSIWRDAGITKVDANGNTIWYQTLKGSKSDEFIEIFELDNGDLISVGQSNSNDSDFVNNKGFSDIIIAKFDKDGNKKWVKSYGGSNYEYIKNAVQHNDNSFYFLSETGSHDKDIIGNNSIYNPFMGTTTDEVWLLNFDSSGNIIRSKCFGGDGGDGAVKIIKSNTKNEFSIVGYSTYSKSGDFANLFFDSTVGFAWICKIDLNLKLKWARAIGNQPLLIRNIDNDRNDNIFGFGDVNDYSEDSKDYHYYNYCSGGGCSNTWDIFACRLAPDSIIPYPTIQGYIYSDNNLNNQKDSFEPYKQNVKVQLSNGNYTFTDKNGFYQIQTDTIGNHSISIIAPNGYAAIPQTVNYNFTTWDTIVNQNIALQPTKVFDSLTVTCLPLTTQAIINNPLPIALVYENVGTTSLNVNAGFSYNNSLLSFDSCNQANCIALANGVASQTNNLQPNNIDGFLAYHTVKPSATVGNLLNIVYNADANSINLKDSLQFLIEPNSSVAKSKMNATKNLTMQELASGKAIDYHISFVNDGNEVANNIIITDTLSSSLKWNSISIKATTHNCKISVVKNVVTIELLNINLPSYNSNKIKSMGAISFSILPKTNLAQGTVINHAANVYINYRLPKIISASTIISNLLPLKFVNFTAQLLNQSESFISKLIWQTANELNVSHFIIQKSVDGKTFINLGKVTAKNNVLNEYIFNDEQTRNEKQETLYYKIIAVDKNGNTTFSSIQKIDYKNSKSGITVYPNPTKELLNISSKKEIKEILLINSLGQIVKKVQLTNASKNHILNLYKLSKGIYILSVSTIDNECLKEKIIVE